jgi:hypothetical protein
MEQSFHSGATCTSNHLTAIISHNNFGGQLWNKGCCLFQIAKNTHCQVPKHLSRVITPVIWGCTQYTLDIMIMQRVMSIPPTIKFDGMFFPQQDCVNMHSKPESPSMAMYNVANTLSFSPSTSILTVCRREPSFLFS